jgi:hypothetical protein
VGIKASQRRAYRVEYQAAAADGYVIVRTGAGATADVVTQAHEQLQRQGIDARIRRIVPIRPATVTAARPATGAGRVVG